MSEPAELMFRGVKLGPVTPHADGTFIPFEAPLPVGTVLELGGRALRVTRVVEAEAAGALPGMHVIAVDAEPEPEPGAASDSGAASDAASAAPAKKRKRR